MKKKTASLTILLPLLLFIVTNLSAQVTPIDSIILSQKKGFSKGLFLSISPIGTIGFEVGNRNMRNNLSNQGITEKRAIRENNHLGLGYWTGRWKFLIDSYNPQLFFGDFNKTSIIDGQRVDFSYQYYGSRLMVGYRLLNLDERDNLYFNAGVGFARNFLDMRISDSSTSVDLLDLNTPSASSALPRLLQTGGFVDFSLEFLTPFRKRVHLGESFSVGYRHGFSKVPWQTERGSLTNGFSDRSSLIYLKFAFVLSLNKET